MLKIRHIAFASDHLARRRNSTDRVRPQGTQALRFNPNKPDEVPRVSGVFLTDGMLNIAILKFANDQLGKGIDFVGIHHFGVVVDDIKEWTRKLENMGAPSLHEAMPPGAHAEFKLGGGAGWGRIRHNQGRMGGQPACFTRRPRGGFAAE